MTIGSMTVEVHDRIKHLYLDEKWTQKQIADWLTEKSGVRIYQTRVGQWLRSQGISGLTHSERMDLPPFTSQQTSLIIGTMLGDGSTTPTGAAAARLRVGHSMADEQYVRWKAGILGQHVARISSRRYIKGGKIVLDKYFTSYASSHMAAVHRMFYDEQGKVFPSLDTLGPLALAVWYQDDGTLKGTSVPILCYGSERKSLDDIEDHVATAVDCLSRSGIEAHYKPTKLNQWDIIIDSADRFFDLITPYIQPCMRRKLPVKRASGILAADDVTVRRLVDEGYLDSEIADAVGLTMASVRSLRKRHRIRQLSYDARRIIRGFPPLSSLSHDRCQELQDAGMEARQIATMFGVSKSMVSKTMKSVGYKPKRVSPTVTLQVANQYLSKFDPVEWATLSAVDKNRWVKEIVIILRRLGFPHINPPPQDEVDAEFDKTRRSIHRCHDFNLSYSGASMATRFFPHLYCAWRSDKDTSTWNAWFDNDALAKAVIYQLNVGDPVLPFRVVKALTMQYRTPTNFRPVSMGVFLKNHLPAGGRVWDPCLGYGGRMWGVMAHPEAYHYIGTDVMGMSVASADEMGASLCVAGSESTWFVNRQKAQDGISEKVDLVFTSPPYFDRERYDDSPDQSWRDCPGVQGWLDGFMAPVADAAFVSLSSGGVMGLNVADQIQAYGTRVNMAELVTETVTKCGFVLADQYSYPLRTLGKNAKSPWEPILVFRRK